MREPNLRGQKVIPAAVQAKLHRSLLLQRQGRLIDAERAFQAAVRQAPMQFDALYLLGQSALQTNRTERAVDLIVKAIRLNPNVAAAYVTLASAQRALEHHEDALASYDRAIALQPDLAEAYGGRAIDAARQSR
ncbi:MAG: tetratricopeptide repeat protein [Stellaceae bacterium]